MVAFIRLKLLWQELFLLRVNTFYVFILKMQAENMNLLRSTKADLDLNIDIGKAMKIRWPENTQKNLLTGYPRTIKSYSKINDKINKNIAGNRWIYKRDNKMAKKKYNIGDKINKARQENRILAFEFLNLKLKDASSDYKKGFEEGIKFSKDFVNAGEELNRYFEVIGTDQ